MLLEHRNAVALLSPLRPGQEQLIRKTTHRADSQRKNAAKKLQHSGLATVVVYHIRHRVVHHIDRRFADTDPKDGEAFRKPAEQIPTVGLILLIGAAPRR